MTLPCTTRAPTQRRRSIESDPAAMSGSKTIGARIVLILRAPRRRSARLAAVIPTDSASSSFPKRRFDVYQNPCCIASPSCAIGCTHEAVRGAGILARKTLAVGEQNLVAPGAEFGAFGVLHARIEFQCRVLGGARDLQRAIRGHDSAVRIRQRKLGQRLRMQRRVGQSRPWIGGRQARKLDRIRNEIAERIALQFGRRGGR